MTQILTIVDVMSGYAILRALPDKSMGSVARVIWEVLCEYGTPKIMQSDNGTEFVNSVMQELTKLYGIDHRLITPYHPRANGQVERTNKEVGKGLKKRLVGAKRQWEAWLPLLQLGINQRYLERIGTSPFALMYGHRFNGFDDMRGNAEGDWE